MNKRKIIASLNNLANQFDLQGMTKEADSITQVMIKLAQGMGSELENFLNTEKANQKFRLYARKNTSYNYESRLSEQEKNEISEAIEYAGTEALIDLFEDETFGQLVANAKDQLGLETVTQMIVDKIESAMSEVESYENEDERGYDEDFYGQDLSGGYDDYDGGVADFPDSRYPYYD